MAVLELPSDTELVRLMWYINVWLITHLNSNHVIKKQQCKQLLLASDGHLEESLLSRIWIASLSLKKILSPGPIQKAHKKTLKINFSLTAPRLKNKVYKNTEIIFSQKKAKSDLENKYQVHAQKLPFHPYMNGSRERHRRKPPTTEHSLCGTRGGGRGEINSS